jgi:hypothetical protein
VIPSQPVFAAPFVERGASKPGRDRPIRVGQPTNAAKDGEKRPHSRPLLTVFDRDFEGVLLNKKELALKIYPRGIQKKGHSINSGSVV